MNKLFTCIILILIAGCSSNNEGKLDSVETNDIKIQQDTSFAYSDINSLSWIAIQSQELWIELYLSWWYATWWTIQEPYIFFGPKWDCNWDWIASNKDCYLYTLQRSPYRNIEQIQDFYKINNVKFIEWPNIKRIWEYDVIETVEAWMATIIETEVVWNNINYKFNYNWFDQEKVFKDFADAIETIKILQ